MLKIGIIGSDSSHAIAFSQLANVDKLAGDQCRVVGIWGQEASHTREVAEKGQIGTIVQKLEELLDLADAAFVVDRHGDLHAEHALPFLERGLPVFVDKPFGIGLEDCLHMLETAKHSGALLTSFSTLRYAPATQALATENIGDIKAAHLAGPCDFESQYGGPFFYLKMLESGERPLSDAQLLRPIAMVHAIEQALKSGKEVHVPQLLEAHT